MGGVAALDDDHVWAMVSKWSSGSKIVIFTLDPAAQEQCYIINESSGHWDNEGMWWSNTTYKPSVWASSYISTASPKEYHDATLLDNECGSCGAMQFEDGNPYYCEMCYSCFDCNGMYADSCMCYTPEHSKAGYTLGERDWWNDGKSYNGWGK
jgi:glutamine amidotransferase